MNATDELAAVAPLPWEAIADAYERLRDAERALTFAGDEFDRMLATAEVDAATAEVERAKDHAAAVGELLVVLMLDRAGVPLRKKLTAVFGDANRVAYDRATAAGKRANWAVNELDALKTRIRELEELVARITPGVKETGK